MSQPHILTYDAITPTLAAPPLCGARVTLIGRLVMGADAVLGDRALIRADGHDITIGDAFTLGAGGTVHIAHGVYATHIGHRVSADAGAVIHACTVGDDCAIGAGVVILDASVIGAGVILEPGSLVFPGSTLAAGQRYGGQPAVALGAASAAEVAQRRAEIVARVAASLDRDGDQAACAHEYAQNFVASSAAIHGDVQLGAEASIFFSCTVDAGSNRIVIGAQANVQDNSVLRATTGDLMIGAGTTIGHNVTLESCLIGEGCLIGMGAHLAPGTVVDSDTVVAAGTRTEPGTHLTGGQLWGGVPLRILSALKPRHRTMIEETKHQYMLYAQDFRQTDGQR